MKINLGNYKRKVVTTNAADQVNGHIGILGVSGSGKSVEGCRLICDIVEQGGTVLAIDLHGTMADDQIAEKHRTVFKKNLHEINKNDEGIPCGLFTPVSYSDGTEEKPLDTVDSITDILAIASRLGSAQMAELRGAVQYLVDTGDYEEAGIQSLDMALHYAGNKTAERVREKLHAITAHNIFVPGGELFYESKINVFRLSRYSEEVQRMVAEILLAFVWRIAACGTFKLNNIYVFIDEFQNLAAGKDSILARMLSEGRKYGINLILATQMIPKAGSSIVMQRLMQCGTLLYFKPAANSVNATARMIDPAKESNWCRFLRTLKVGQFIAVGDLLVGGKKCDDPLLISAVEPSYSAVHDKYAHETHELNRHCDEVAKPTANDSKKPHSAHTDDFIISDRCLLDSAGTSGETVNNAGAGKPAGQLKKEVTT